MARGTFSEFDVVKVTRRIDHPAPEDADMRLYSVSDHILGLNRLDNSFSLLSDPVHTAFASIFRDQ